MEIIIDVFSLLSEFIVLEDRKKSKYVNVSDMFNAELEDSTHIVVDALLPLVG